MMDIALDLGYWRSRRDSNPRYGRTVYRISSAERCIGASLEAAPILGFVLRVQCAGCSDSEHSGEFLPT
jgi:hypothetical protein